MNHPAPRPTPKLPTHDCPGGCGAQVPHHRFACPGCWGRLPRDLARAITGNFRRDFAAHVAAMTDARRWYGKHPLPGGRDNPDAPRGRDEASD
jgi:hypothetical protein